MAVWSGLGVNYKSLSKISADISYFNKIGLNKVRIHIPQWDDSDISLWRTCAKTFYDAGFYVVYGASMDDITAENWSTQALGIKAEALAAQEENCCSEFQIGNEYELNHDGSITDLQIRNNVRLLATEVQDIFTSGIISYAVSQGSSGGWVSDASKGNLDKLSFNTYGGISNKVVGTQYKSYINSMYQIFGDNTYISEFHLDSSNANLLLLNSDKTGAGMRELLKFIKGSGIQTSYVFQYRGHKDQNNQFAMCYTDDTFSQAWDALISNGGRISFLER